jgi:hypothetical protein
MDFGAGHYAGAPTLAAGPLPPGTSRYRSPEAWRFALFFGHRPTARYVARPADGLRAG